jgi:plastocyanin domain-containing protein
MPIIIGLSLLGVLLSLPKRTVSRNLYLGVGSLLIVFSVLILNFGWFETKASTPNESIDIVDGKQLIQSTLSSGKYPKISVNVGTPVKWVISAPEGSINGCNKRMIIPDYGIEYTFNTGDNVIEFTPNDVGTVPYSCWMGMIHGSIIVTEAGQAAAQDLPETTLNDTIEPILSDYKIPVSEVATAQKVTDEYGDEIYEVTIELTDTGFSPALIIQPVANVKWNLVNKSSNQDALLVSEFQSLVDLEEGLNEINVFAGNDFDFSTGDFEYFGYVYIVDDIESASVEKAKALAKIHSPLIYPLDYFENASCHKN